MSSQMFNPHSTSTQRFDIGWRAKIGAESIPAYPSKDYVTAEPHTFTTIKNIYTGGFEEVLVEPMHHAGVVTLQQQQAVQENLMIGDGVRITLEGNIGSGMFTLCCFNPNCCTAFKGKSTLGWWYTQALRDRGIPAHWKPEKIDEWRTESGNLLDTSRKDPR